MKRHTIIITIAAVVLVVAITSVLFLVLGRQTPNSSPIKKDTAAPTVKLYITAETLEAAKTTKILSVSATAEDDQGISRVEYQLDKKVAGDSTKTPYAVSLDISKLTAGTHTVQAFASDAAGNVGKSDPFDFRLDEDHAVTPANPESNAMVGSPPPVAATPGTQTPPPSGGGGDTPPPPPPPPVSCALPAYPDASCTGVPSNTSLTVMNGDMTISTPGTIIEDKDINGCIVINASNVIIRRSKVTCHGYAITNAGSGSTGLLVEDVEISCTQSTGSNALTSHDYIARRVNVHDCNDVLWAENNVLIEDSYIHDVTHFFPAEDNHTDGVQIPENQTNIIVRHNRIYGNYESPTSFGNSAITAQGGGDSNILIENNLLAGGGYTLACYDVNSPTANGPNTNFRIINNHFSRIFVSTVGGFGPWVGCGDEAQVTGNVYHETGLPVPF